MGDLTPAMRKALCEFAAEMHESTGEKHAPGTIQTAADFDADDPNTMVVVMRITMPESAWIEAYHQGPGA